MDYFTELLESYNKLKKRTFKLKYISEAEDKKKKPNEKEEKLAKVKESVGAVKDAFSAALGGSNQIGVGNSKNLNFEVADPDPTGNPQVKVSGSNIGSKIYNNAMFGNLNFTHSGAAGYKLAAAWSGGDTDMDDAQDSAATEEAENQAFEEQLRTKIGGFFTFLGRSVASRTIAALRSLRTTIENFCINQKDTDDYKNLCQNNGLKYIVAGEGSMGLEYKLATAVHRTIKPDGTTEAKPEDKGSDPALVAQSAESYNFLISFLTNQTDDKCDNLSKRIGIYGNGTKLVLFGDSLDADSNPNEGIVIEKNNLSKLALKQVEEFCEKGVEGLTRIIDSKGGNQSKNSVKGTFYENILTFSIAVNAANNLTDDTLKAKEKKKAAADLMAHIKEKRGILLDIFKDMNLNAGQEIPEAIDTQEQEEILALLEGSGDDLKERLLKEVRSTFPLVEFMDADSVDHSGGQTPTGGRDDVKFLYSDKTVAEKKAEAIGSTAVQRGDMWEVGIGLKRLSALHGPKLGEINSMTRMISLVLGEVDDHRIDSDFEKGMMAMQFGDTSPGTEGERRQKNMFKFVKRFEAALVEQTSPISDGQTYLDDDGNIKSQSSSEIIKMISTSLVNMTTLESLEKSIIAGEFFHKDGDGNIDTANPKNFSGDDPGAVSNRRRAQEVVERVARFNKLRKIIEEDGNDAQAAKDYLIKSMLICGSNARDMGQVAVDDKGDMMVIKHNAAFRIICDATSPTFNFSESGVAITGDGITLTYGQEGTTQSFKDKILPDGTPEPVPDRRDTRSNVNMSKRTFEDPRIQADITTQQTNSTFQEYITGHIKLLETFLTQTM